MRSFLEFGKALFNGDFEGAVKAAPATQTFPINPSNYSTPVDPGFAFMTDGITNSYFQYSNISDCNIAYTKCPPVTSIINKKAQAFINGQTWILNTKDKDASNTSLEAKSLSRLLRKPNYLQSWEQFEIQMYVYVQLYGYCPILVMKPIGYKRTIDATAMWCIPPTALTIEETRKIFSAQSIDGAIKQITIRFMDEDITVNAADFLIIRDVTPNISSYLLPDSRLRSQEMPVNNIIGAYESRNVLINYRGALGIFSKDGSTGTSQYPALPATKEEKDALQQDFKRYGLRRKQWQFIITSAALKWQQISVPTKDLMLFEEIEGDQMSLCDAYNFPYQLMASGKGVTFSNLNDAKKLLYQDATIPESRNIYSQFANYFELASYNLKLQKDYSKVPALQADAKEEAEARKTRDDAYKIEWDNDVCTLDEWRVANGDDPIPVIGGLRRSQLLATTDQPLISVFGVDGTQALIDVISAPGISADAAEEILITVFRIPQSSAARMVAGKTAQTQNNEQGSGQQTETSQAA